MSPARPRKVALLGSTGTIGRAALSVIAALPEELTVFGLAARSSVRTLAEQAVATGAAVVALTDPSRVEEFRGAVGSSWKGTLLTGPDAAETLAGLAEPDVILNGLVGAAGLRPTWRALVEGKAVALANKESLVIAGEPLMRAAASSTGRLLPVDSEHSGLFQCLDGHAPEGVGRIVLTASGGPFRTRPLQTLAEVTPAEALRHPTWAMGPRITVDSATLLNKGFEVLEAHWLFGVPADRIEVWVHPQSIVHGLVEWIDGSTTAQLSSPDMRIPIQYALCYPDRAPGQIPPCDLTRLGALEFSLPDPRRYPCLDLARQALREGGTAPAVLNAADEVLVAAFLGGTIRFPQIPELLLRVLSARPAGSAPDLDELQEADRWARVEAARAVQSAQ